MPNGAAAPPDAAACWRSLDQDLSGLSTRTQLAQLAVGAIGPLPVDRRQYRHARIRLGLLLGLGLGLLGLIGLLGLVVVEDAEVGVDGGGDLDETQTH